MRLIERDEVRELLRKPLLDLCETYGPARVARNLGGLDRATVSDARDEKSTLSLENALNLLTLDINALQGLMAHFGLKTVPIDCCVDGYSLVRLQEAKSAIEDVMATVRPSVSA